MRYGWDQWILDCNEGHLCRHGEPIPVSRKVLLCISYLVVHRDRVVGYDELVQALWGHANVNNHQLSQVILAARRMLGDDRQTQRVIRTATGKGYQWVAPVVEIEPAASISADVRASSAVATQASVAVPPLHVPASPQSQPEQVRASAPGRFHRRWLARIGDAVRGRNAERLAGSEPPPRTTESPAAGSSDRRRFRLLSGAIAASVLTIAICGAVLTRGSESPDGSPGSTIEAGDEISAIRKSLSMGLHDDAREALSLLPQALAESSEARLIEIDLSIQRGRFDRAAAKLAAEIKAEQVNRDPVWRAQLLMRQCMLDHRRNAPGAEVFAAADAAVGLLQSNPQTVAPQLLAEALRMRANGYNLTDRSDAALRDLAEAMDLFERADDANGVATVRASRARTWMRMGRMTDALEELTKVAEEFRRSEQRVNELLARNTMAKIQIESLQWEHALVSTERSLHLLRDMQDSERRYPTLQLRALALVGVGRLREASSLLEEADTANGRPLKGIIPAIFHLESDQPKAALDAAAAEFDTNRLDTRSNLLLENREGALLLWVMAAQALTEHGETLPKPSAAQLAMLESPTNPVARIARGRWLLLTGEHTLAERELRDSLMQAQSLNQRMRMMFAVESLVDLSLRKADIASANRILDDMYGYDPDTMDKDYRFWLLRLRVTLADENPAEVETVHRTVLDLAGQRQLPRRLENLYAERRRQEGGAIWSGSVASGER